MIESSLKLVEAVQAEVQAFFEQHQEEKRAYHNLAHTQAVVAAAKQIGDHYQLNDQDFEVVQIAAWFHDIGYHIEPDAHERAGAEAAAAFLQKKGQSEALITKVQGCIMATKMPQDPHNLLEEIVCDADLFHLGQDRFNQINECMCQEKGQSLGKVLTKQQWRLGTIAFLEAHHYHTDYCQMLLSDKKAANLARLKKKAASAAAKMAKKPQEVTLKQPEPSGNIKGTLPADGAVALEQPEKVDQGGDNAPYQNKEQKGRKEKKQKKEKTDKPDKGIETMFRVTAGNNQKLSNMADNKAHILISVNSIILSAVISLLLRKLDAHEELIIPTFILITVSLITIIFSILSTRPTIPKGTFTRQDIEEKKTNLLFFGNFYKMKLEQYTEGMWKVMDDRDFLYGSLIKDVYAQGVVLGKKYRLLRTAYNVFMYGLVLSVIAYMIGVMVS
ncbi:hypothetical protein GCM10027566_17970 [Arachidicoccus ginsenosidivorans]|jgi:predicted metal-dependent HD superfamily phosphohydrolase|uniref:HD domain-containing protein n=1 Tax=Arachidicoccus ginsenosidivorans TaxID=496057 RepID=A0A5B8VHU0_9BACT|nr:Pycsar system effector family protein [Arachidicoccus ginsenosidivorans]QEC70743.1 HD domain-containing protein [Arachidicoccus ginsenosidivorans]